MIRIVIAAALSALTAAECGDHEPPKTAPPPFEWGSLDAASTAPTASSTGSAPGVDPADAHLVALKKMDVALAGADPKAYADLFATDAVVTVPGISEWKGRNDITAMHAKIFHPLDDVKVGTSRVWIRRDLAAVEWTLVGTHARTWLGVPATSKPIAIHGLSVSAFDADGRVKSQRIYFDVISVLAQVGAALPGFEVAAVSKLPTSTEVIVAQASPEEDANVALNDSSAKLMEQGNLDAAVAVYADDVEFFGLGGPPAKGRDAMRKRIDATWKAMTERKVTIDGWGVKGFVVEEVTLAAVNTGSFRGAAPTKNPVKLHGASILELKDKKIVRQWSFSNRAELLTQLGVKYAR